MKHCKTLFFSFLFFLYVNLSAVSVVYNMRVRRTFAGSGEVIGKKDESVGVATVLPIFFTRNSNIIDETRNLQERTFFGGSVLNIRGIGKRRKWFAEITTAVARESAKFKGTPQIFEGSRSGFDDIVFTIGRNFFAKKEMQFAVYGLAGVPTKFSVRDQTTPNPLVGTRFYGTGLGTEFSYGVIRKVQKQSIAFIVQNRFLHFYTRRFFPVLPRDSKIQPGNLIDLLFALRFTFTTNLIESGYDLTIFNDQAIIRPEQKIRTRNSFRHSYYLNFMHLFIDSIFSRPFALGSGMSYSHSKAFDARTFIWWVNCSLIF